MRKCCAVLLCVLLLAGLVSSASAQTVACPEAHLILTIPDEWTSVPLTQYDDPDLRLLLEGRDISLSLYLSDTGGMMPEAFQVFTGDETETFTVTLSGVEMTCVAGESEEGDYRIYTWLDRRNQVQLWFLVTGSPEKARKVIEEIMNTLVFE